MAKNLITPVLNYEAELPQEIRDLIKPLTHPVILRWFEMNKVVALQGKDQMWTPIPSERIGQQTILSHWSFVYKGHRVNTGFFNGYDADFNPQFHTVTFEKGTLRLEPKNPLHHEIWEKIQIHPFFKDNVLGLTPKTGSFRFHTDDVMSRQLAQTELIKLTTKVRAALLDLEPEEQEIVRTTLGCETELDLLRFAEADPTTTMNAVKNLSVISVRDMVEKCFKPPYNLLVTDTNQNALLWAEGRKAIFSHSDNTVNLPEAFTYYLLGVDDKGQGKPQPTKEAKAKLRTLRDRISEIDKELAAAKEAKAALAKEANAAPLTTSVDV
jgi:hypothetical protein